MDFPRFYGPVIITRYAGPTYSLGSRVIASHKRDSETRWTARLSWDPALNSETNHKAAAEALLRKWPLGEGQDAFFLIACGHDHDHYYWTAIQPWQLADQAS
jgi:hypothetical protein